MSIKEKQDRLPTLYWLPKLHKRPYKARFVANSSSCTTTNLSKLLTSCLTVVKKHWIRYYDTVYERDGINFFWSIKNSNDVLNKFKSKNFQASKKGKRKVQGVPQSQTAALPRPKEEEDTDKSKQAQTEQTYEKH